MKPINYTKPFQKNLKKRFGHQPKILLQFRNRTAQFQQGRRGNPLNDHSLGGNMLGLRSFSVTGDVRVIYRETEDAYEFIDIGTHSQVYGK